MRRRHETEPAILALGRDGSALPKRCASRTRPATKARFSRLAQQDSDGRRSTPSLSFSGPPKSKIIVADKANGAWREATNVEISQVRGRVVRLERAERQQVELEEATQSALTRTGDDVKQLSANTDPDEFLRDLGQMAGMMGLNGGSDEAAKLAQAFKLSESLTPGTAPTGGRAYPWLSRNTARFKAA